MSGSNNSNEFEPMVRSPSSSESSPTNNTQNEINTSDESSPDTFINYGDDVGFIMTPSDVPIRSSNSASSISIDRSISSSSSSSNNEYVYAGIADGVSANRLRGYDARLFPFALLTSCVKFIKEDRPEFLPGLIIFTCHLGS